MTTKELIAHLNVDPNIKIYFHNPECGHCKELASVVTIIPDIHMVNTYNENEEVSDLFEIEHVPALAIVTETDAGLDFVTYTGPDQIKEYLM
jgi:thiol-disulfide isomerase/thioredoxin